jgi:fluoride exporter
MTWWQWVLVGVAGAVGAPLRYVVDTLVGDRLGSTFPMGTLVVNVSGSFALGLISGLVLFDGLGSGPNVVVGSGLVGAYTTFSTWTFETMTLVEEGQVGLAVRNVAVSAAVGAAAAAAGLALAGL